FEEGTNQYFEALKLFLEKEAWENFMVPTNNKAKMRLKPSRHICIEESVAIFMITLAHECGNRLLQETFSHSKETIHRHFYKVLKAVLRLSADIIKPNASYNEQVPQQILNNPRYYLFFKNLNEALRRPEVKFPILIGEKYYVVDAGYPNTRGYLAPYKGINIHYHLPDFHRGRTAAIRLGELAPTKLIVELADRIVKRPKGIVENVLVGIDKFVFPVEFIVLDVSEDIKVPLILERPFLSTAYAKIDVCERKNALRIRNDKIVFKNLLELNDLNEPLNLRRNQEVNDLGPTIVEGEVIDEPMVNIVKTRHDDENIEGIDEYLSFYDYDRNIHINFAYNLQVSCMIVVENMDAYHDKDMGDVIVRKPFLGLHVLKQDGSMDLLPFMMKNQQVLPQYAISSKKIRCICALTSQDIHDEEESYTSYPEDSYAVFSDGPRKLPVIGNLHQLAGGLAHRVLRDLAKKHGPIMHIQLAQVSTIIISSPRLAKEVLKTHDLAIANRPHTFATEILFYGHTDIVFAPYGEYWRQIKKTCSLQLFSAKKVRSFGAIRELEFVSFMKSISLLSSGESIDLHEKIFEMFNNVVCVSSFGKNCRQQRELLETIGGLSGIINGFYLADLFPDYKFVPVILGSRSKVLKMWKSFDKILEEILEDRCSNLEAHQGDLLDVLLRIKEEDGLETNNIKAILLDMFVGGTETSSITIIWAMAELIRNPVMMKKVQSEVREAFDGKKTITEADIQSLSYMHLVVKETLRLHSPTPLMLPHECNQACKVDGYDIQAKQKVIINIWACQTDPDYWEDAETFKPERFEKTTIDYMGTDYEYLPFGAGRRMCPGITFGITTMEFFLAHMLYFYDWKLPHGLNPNDLDMTETGGTLAGKKERLRLIPTLCPKALDNAFYKKLQL
nr:costunolide synthase [Tanacetum cinerariifolium]GEV30302.1 costunolide synthase [Tanacetum cinerariifolium]